MSTKWRSLCLMGRFAEEVDGFTAFRNVRMEVRRFPAISCFHSVRHTHVFDKIM